MVSFLARLKNACRSILGPVEQSGFRETALFASVIVVIPTIIFIVVSDRFGFLLPRLNFDFLAVYALSVIIARRSRGLGVAIAVFGTFIVLFFQIAFGLGAIYIDDPALVREYLGFVDKWPWRLIGFWGAIGIGAIFVFYIIIRRLEISRARVWPIALLFVGLVSVDVLSRFPQGYSLIGRNPVTSSTWRARNMVRNLLTKPRFKITRAQEPMMSNVVKSDMARPDKLLSIAVEAWGLSKDHSENMEILKPLIDQLGKDYIIQIARHRGHGTTITGELRELCNARTIGTPTAQDARSIADLCLPSALRKRGYNNLALHGNSRVFYNRYQLYPALGFNKSVFYDDVISMRNGFRLCRKPAFEGICDEDMLRLGLQHLSGSGRRYAHLMTLDTHFPLSPDANAGYTCSADSPSKNEEICLYVNQFASLMRRLGKQIEMQKVKPDRIYLFGDHRPPYALAVLRDHFLPNDVPFITLTLRNSRAGQH